MRIISKVRHHAGVSRGLKEYAEAKLHDKCEQYLSTVDQSIVAEVEFDNQFGPKSGNDKRVDLTVTLPYEHLPLHIEESDNTFKEAVDKAIDRLDQPLERYKETTLS